jgi:cobalamin biosynthetic protein CobC
LLRRIGVVIEELIMPVHGGNLNDAVARYSRPREEWIDLSTGINPLSYPVPPLSISAWHRLPEPHARLRDAAQAYYHAPQLLPVAGTQAAIQALPRLRPRSHVIVGAPAYAEHAHCWRQAGHAVDEVDYALLDAFVDDSDVMVVCNPNNPTGATIEPEVLRDWSQRLASRQGWLIVDEAFADTIPSFSVAQWTQQPGLIVLRSVGKFFGLAGLRLGFVAAHSALLAQLDAFLGPWTITGPAQEIGCAALSDRDWQARTRHRLQEDGARLHMLLDRHGIAARGCALFQWWPEAQAERFHRHMAEQGIWVRLFEHAAHGIRIGLPGNESEWQRLEDALKTWSDV